MPNDRPRILITGANGPLGCEVSGIAVSEGMSIVGSSRNMVPAGFPGEWRQFDLLNQASVSEALEGIDIVIHCASVVAHPEQDTAALTCLISAAQIHKCRLNYVSICGIDEAAQFLPYYRMKVDNEEMLLRSGLSVKVIRIAQFHPFVSMIVSQLIVGPLALCPRFSLQPVDISYAASQLLEHSLQAGSEPVVNVCGPEVINSGELITSWCRMKGIRKLVVPFPSVSRLRALRTIITRPGEGGGKRWHEWLETARQDNHYPEKRL